MLVVVVTIKHLGTEEGDGTDNSQMKDKLIKEYHCWVHQIFKTELNSKNHITPINTLAVRVLVYSFETVNWLRKEIEKTDQNTRSLTSTEGIHHPKAGVNKLCTKKQSDGNRLVKLESAYNAATVGLSKYLKRGEDRLVRLMQEYNTKKIKYSLQYAANRRQ